MKEAVTTVLDVIAIAALITGAFFVSFGLGLIASGATLGLISWAISKQSTSVDKAQ